MLQIVTGMYFRDVPLNETLHRAVFYTNSWALPSGPIELPVGRFLFATRPSAITAVTIEAVERLEAVRINGEPELLIATSGTELLNDAAAVFAFALNITCSRSVTLLERLVPTILDPRPSSKPSNILRRTFDPRSDPTSRRYRQCSGLLHQAPSLEAKPLRSGDASDPHRRRCHLQRER